MIYNPKGFIKSKTTKKKTITPKTEIIEPKLEIKFHHNNNQDKKVYDEAYLLTLKNALEKITY